jgi:hypothetical protein
MTYWAIGSFGSTRLLVRVAGLMRASRLDRDVRVKLSVWRNVQQTCRPNAVVKVLADGVPSATKRST